MTETNISTLLPALPKAGSALTSSDLLHVVRVVAQQVSSIDDIGLLQEWRSKAAALEAYLKSRELQRPILGAQRMVEARIGQLLPDAGEAERAGVPLGHDLRAVKKDDRSDFRILARGFEFLEGDEWCRSRRALVSDIRKYFGLIPETPPLPEGQFRCIVADPPWQMTTGPNTFGSLEAGDQPLDYTTMPVADIQALPVEKCSADDAHLYLWTTNRYVEQAYGVARAWGFKPSVLLVWAKPPHGIGLGGAYRLTTEFILYARRGTLQELDIIDTNWFDWPRGKHSEKPDEFYDMVETVNYPPCLEMFARRPRDGWTVWGAEV